MKTRASYCLKNLYKKQENQNSLQKWSLVLSEINIELDYCQ